MDITPMGETAVLVRDAGAMELETAEAQAALSGEGRTWLRARCEAMRVIETHPDGIWAGCQMAARMHSGERGWSVNRLYKMHRAWCAGDGVWAPRSWELLVDRAREGGHWLACAAEDALPMSFLEFWRGLVERHQRNTAQAHRELRQIWRTHVDSLGRSYEKLPGYDRWPVVYGKTGLPFGWSVYNLMRFIPNTFELRLGRIGQAAATELRPAVFTTRVGIKIGQYYLFDDHEANMKCYFPGSPAMRPRGFFALDLASACCFAWGMKPTRWDATEEKKKALTEKDMMWLVVEVLVNHGWREDTKTTLIVEHGTAAIRPDFEARILAATGGMVVVGRSGFLGGNQLDHLFPGRDRGNYRFKAALESWFNALDNHLQMLPGQVGLDRLTCPEETHGRVRAADALAKQIEQTTPEIGAQARMPVATWWETLDFAAEKIRQLNERTEHDLEGWDAAGNIAREWRPAQTVPWMAIDSLEAMPEAQRAAMQTWLQGAPDLLRIRKLSPGEVWQRGKRELRRLPSALVGQLLPPDMGHKLKVRGGLLTCEERERMPGKLRYLATTQGGGGVPAQRLSEGREVLMFVDPANPARALCYTADDDRRFIGAVQQWEQPCRSDVEGVKRQQGAQAHWEAEERRDAQRRGQTEALENELRAVQNERLLAGKTAEEGREAERLRDQAEAALEAGMRT